MRASIHKPKPQYCYLVNIITADDLILLGETFLRTNRECQSIFETIRYELLSVLSIVNRVQEFPNQR